MNKSTDERITDADIVKQKMFMDENTKVANNLRNELSPLGNIAMKSPKEVGAMMQIHSAFVGKEPEAPNPLVIYHGNCADGFSAAWIFWKAMTLSKKDADGIPTTVFDFHAGVYNDPPPDVSDRDVYLVDFSYKRQVVKDMINIGGAASVTILDHHKSAMEDLKGLEEELFEEWKIANAEMGDVSPDAEYVEQLHMTFDMEHSGCMLAWKFWESFFELVGFVRPLLLDHVEDRDLWRFKLPLTREIQANVFSYEYTFENWDTLMCRSNTVILAEGGTAIERKHHKDVAELVKLCQRLFSWKLPNGDYKDVPIASIPYTMSSDAGNLMAKDWCAGTYFSACYWDTPTHRVFSLRSTENGMDVSEIAKEFGGGGHKHAAGFRVPRNHILATS